MKAPSAARVAAYVRRHPHKTCAEIAQELEAPAALVSVFLRELRKAGKIDSEGNTKGTRWFPVTSKDSRPRHGGRPLSKAEPGDERAVIRPRRGSPT